ncbi:hypothetical protein ACWJKU_04750 [Methylocaldum sp. MU1018]
MKELSEKHLAVATALALGLVIFWLIASDYENAAALSATDSPLGAIAAAMDGPPPN